MALKRQRSNKLSSRNLLPRKRSLEQLRGQVTEEKDRYLRLMAEFENYRRRTTKEKEAAYPEAVANIVKELLPVVDNFQRLWKPPAVMKVTARVWK